MSVNLSSVDKNVVEIGNKKSPISKTVREFRTRVSIVGSGKIAYELQLLQEFARNQIIASFLMPLFVLGITAMLLQWRDWKMPIAWASFTICSYIILGLISHRFLKAKDTKEQLPFWRVLFILPNVFIALSWIGFSLGSLPNTPDIQHLIFQFSCVLILQASCCILGFAFMRSTLLVMMPASLCLAVQYVITYDSAKLMMASIIALSLIFFFMLTSRLKGTLLTNFENTKDKELLIAELETEKSISDSARNRAEEANLAKSRFLATMSHELRTPLNAILGFSEVMRDEVMGPMENELYHGYVSDIHSSGSHLLKLINEILDISRIEADKYDLKEEDMQLVSIVEEAKRMLEIKAKQKDISIATHYEDNLPKIWVDERAVHQIVLNLISNALKFTPAGGMLTLKVGWTRKGGQYISVKDTGPGIPENEIPIVLSSFGQGTIAIKDAEPGTGLGLTIVQGLLQMHQGSFTLKSKLKIGTEAIATFPKERVFNAAKHASMSTPIEQIEEVEPQVA